jgi:hypothetical protein
MVLILQTRRRFPRYHCRMKSEATRSIPRWRSAKSAPTGRRSSGWFPADCTEPAPLSLFEDLNLEEARGEKQRPLVLHAWLRRSKQFHYRPQQPIVLRALVRLGDDHQPSAGLQHAQNLTHVILEIGPVVLRLHGCGYVEPAIFEREILEENSAIDNAGVVPETGSHGPAPDPHFFFAIWSWIVAICLSRSAC